MNIFGSMTLYKGSWSVKGERKFTDEEIQQVDHAVVTEASNEGWNNAVCFFFKAGGHSYMPLAQGCNLSVGDTVDLTKGKIITLGRQGDNDIYRFDCE